MSRWPFWGRRDSRHPCFSLLTPWPNQARKSEGLAILKNHMGNGCYQDHSTRTHPEGTKTVSIKHRTSKKMPHFQKKMPILCSGWQHKNVPATENPAPMPNSSPMLNTHIQETNQTKIGWRCSFPESEAKAHVPECNIKRVQICWYKSHSTGWYMSKNML